MFSVGETEDTAPKLGEDMPKIATKMRAQRSSKCPECHYPIVVGTDIRVFDNKWLHTKCWSDVKDRKNNIKGSQKVISNIVKKFTNKIINSLGVINKEIDSIWEYIGKEKTTADEYNE